MKPKQFFFIVLGGLVVLVGALGAGYYEGYKLLQSQSQGLATKLDAEDVASQQITSLTSIRHEYTRDIVPILPLIDEALPRDKKQTEILAQIERVASTSGLSLGAINLPGSTGLPTNISQTTAASGVLALPINFKIAGSYDQLQAFTSHLEELNRYTDITILSVSQDGSGTPTYSYNLNAYIKP